MGRASIPPLESILFFAFFRGFFISANGQIYLDLHGTKMFPKHPIFRTGAQAREKHGLI